MEEDIRRAEMLLEGQEYLMAINMLKPYGRRNPAIAKKIWQIYDENLQFDDMCDITSGNGPIDGICHFNVMQVECTGTFF